MFGAVATEARQRRIEPGPLEGGRRRRLRQAPVERGQCSLDVAAGVVVMANRGGVIGIALNARVGPLVRCPVDVRCQRVARRHGHGTGRPRDGVSQSVLRLRKAVQVHGRQQGDTQTDAEIANAVRQRMRLLMPD